MDSAKHINGRVTLILLLILLRVIFAVNQENSELTVAGRERLVVDTFLGFH